MLLFSLKWRQWDFDLPCLFGKEASSPRKKLRCQSFVLHITLTAEVQAWFTWCRCNVLTYWWYGEHTMAEEHQNSLLHPQRKWSTCDICQEAVGKSARHLLWRIGIMILNFTRKDGGWSIKEQMSSSNFWSISSFFSSDPLDTFCLSSQTDLAGKCLPMISPSCG